LEAWLFGIFLMRYSYACEVHGFLPCSGIELMTKDWGEGLFVDAVGFRPGG
jgi:hypothetical protein